MASRYIGQKQDKLTIIGGSKGENPTKVQKTYLR